MREINCKDAILCPLGGEHSPIERTRKVARFGMFSDDMAFEDEKYLVCWKCGKEIRIKDDVH